MENLIQKAGSNSKQIQANTLIVGIDEKRVREIFDEKINIAIKDFSSEAAIRAKERVEEFERKLIPKITRIGNGLSSFADPNFQLNLIEAQKSAAGTERMADYDLLSELLIHRVQKGENRETRTGIKKAIQIVGDISDEALLGLTVVDSFGKFYPTTGDIEEGLNVLDHLFGELMYESLPTGTEWIDHLDILDAVRINYLSRFTDIIALYVNNGLKGYVDVGFKNNSDAHKKAIEIFSVNKMPTFGSLVKHSLNPEYIRLNLPNINSIDNLSVFILNKNGITVHDKLSERHKNAIKEVYNLYDADEKIRMQNINAFRTKWDSRPNLKKLTDWIVKIPNSFNITSIGHVLAHSNAQRCSPDIPSLE